jgi:hypothetical protein
MIVHAWCAVLALSAASATPDKVTLYIQERTSLLKAASPTADVVKELPAGDEVMWLKTDPPKKGWFKVSHGTEAGFVQRASLATQRPNLTVASKATSISSGNEAIATSGAAQKSAAEESREYANAKGLGNELGQLEALEKVASKVDAAAATAHARKNGLTAPVQKGGK